MTKKPEKLITLYRETLDKHIFDIKKLKEELAEREKVLNNLKMSHYAWSFEDEESAKLTMEEYLVKVSKYDTFTKEKGQVVFTQDFFVKGERYTATFCTYKKLYEGHTKYWYTSDMTFSIAKLEKSNLEIDKETE